MRLLLDSHTFLWWIGAQSELSAGTSDLIATAEVVCISLVIPWELTIKHRRGKLTLPEIDWHALDQHGVEMLPATLDDVLLAAELPSHHRDPFDRLIIAQASRRELTIVTRDVAFLQYDIPLLRA